MANLTRRATYGTEVRAGRDSWPIADGVTLFPGALVGVNAAGYLDKWSDTAGMILAGILLAGNPDVNPLTGSTSTTPNPEGRVNVNGDYIRDVPIATLTQAGVNSKVYCTTDNLEEDCTLTAASNVGEIGIVTRFRSAGRGDIQLYSHSEGRISAP